MRLAHSPARSHEGSALLSLGVIEDLQSKSVEKGRRDVERSLKIFRRFQEVSEHEQD